RTAPRRMLRASGSRRDRRRSHASARALPTRHPRPYEAELTPAAVEHVAVSVPGPGHSRADPNPRVAGRASGTSAAHRERMSKHLILCSLLFSACVDPSESRSVVLDESTSAAARGRLDLIKFDLETDGTTKTAVISTLEDAPLIETTLREDGSRTTQI